MARPLIDTAVEIARERSKLLGHIWELLKAGDDLKALELMKLFFGLNDTANGAAGKERVQ